MRPEKMKLNVQALTSFRIKCLVACALYVAMTASGAAAITAGIDEKIVLPFVLLLSLALPIAMLSLVSFKGRNASVPFDGKAPKGRGTLGLLLTASLAFICRNSFRLCDNCGDGGSPASASVNFFSQLILAGSAIRKGRGSCGSIACAGQS